MNKKAAVALIRLKITELDALAPSRNEGTNEWRERTASVLAQILRPDSPEQKRVKGIAHSGYSVSPGQKREEVLAQHKREIRHRLEHALEQVQTFGPYNEPKPNFLSRVSDKALYTFIPLILTGTLSLGLVLGRYFSDVKNYKLEAQNARMGIVLQELIATSHSVANQVSKAAEGQRAQTKGQP